MKKGFKIQKIASATNESTPPFDTLQEARDFLKGEINEYEYVDSISLTTQTPDKLIWTQNHDGRESVIIQVIDLSKQTDGAPQELLEVGKRIDDFYLYLKQKVQPFDIALEYSSDWDDIKDTLEDCCCSLNELSEYVKGEC